MALAGHIWYCLGHCRLFSNILGFSLLDGLCLQWDQSKISPDSIACPLQVEAEPLLPMPAIDKATRSKRKQSKSPSSS